MSMEDLKKIEQTKRAVQELEGVLGTAGAVDEARKLERAYGALASTVVEGASPRDKAKAAERLAGVMTDIAEAHGKDPRVAKALQSLGVAPKTVEGLSRGKELEADGQTALNEMRKHTDSLYNGGNPPTSSPNFGNRPFMKADLAELGLKKEELSGDPGQVEFQRAVAAHKAGKAMQSQSRKALEDTLASSITANSVSVTPIVQTAAAPPVPAPPPAPRPAAAAPPAPAPAPAKEEVIGGRKANIVAGRAYQTEIQVEGGGQISALDLQLAMRMKDAEKSKKLGAFGVDGIDGRAGKATMGTYSEVFGGPRTDAGELVLGKERAKEILELANKFKTERAAEYARIQDYLKTRPAEPSGPGRPTPVEGVATGTPLPETLTRGKDGKVATREIVDKLDKAGYKGINSTEKLWAAVDDVRKKSNHPEQMGKRELSDLDIGDIRIAAAAGPVAAAQQAPAPRRERTAAAPAPAAPPAPAAAADGKPKLVLKGFNDADKSLFAGLGEDEMRKLAALASITPKNGELTLTAEVARDARSMALATHAAVTKKGNATLQEALAAFDDKGAWKGAPTGPSAAAPAPAVSTAAAPAASAATAAVSDTPEFKAKVAAVEKALGKKSAITTEALLLTELAGLKPGDKFETAMKGYQASHKGETGREDGVFDTKVMTAMVDALAKKYHVDFDKAVAAVASSSETLVPLAVSVPGAAARGGRS